MHEASPGQRVGVVTVSYRSERVLDEFLNSVSRAAGGSRVIIADNSPESGAARELAAHHDADYLPLDHNVGYGAAVDAAVAKLSPTVEWILVCNPDVVLDPGAVGVLMATGDADPTIGAVGPLIRDGDGNIYPSARRIPSLRTGIGHALFVNLWDGNPWTRAYRNESDETATRRDVGWLSGACVLVRRSAFEQLGGFDPGYFMYFEDVDLGYRLGRAGFRNVYEPAASVTHSGAHSTADADVSEAMIREHHRSARRFIDRKYAGWWLAPVRGVLAIGLAMRSAIIRRGLRRR